MRKSPRHSSFEHPAKNTISKTVGVRSDTGGKVVHIRDWAAGTLF